MNPSSNTNDEDPVDTFVAVVIDVPTLAANWVSLTFFVTTKLPLNVDTPVLTLTLFLILRPWLLDEVNVAIPLVGSYVRVVIPKLPPVK